MATKDKANEQQEQEQPQSQPILTITAEELKRLLNPGAQTGADDDRKLDETVPGGRYKVGGMWVDANGKRLGEPSEDAK
jgi:hypothetical protein